MRTINLAFEHLYDDFDVTNNIFTDLLSNYFNICICSYKTKSPEDIDLLIYSSFYTLENRNLIEDHYADVKKLFISGENESPNFNICDFAVTCNDISFGNRHFRLPYYAMSYYNKELLERTWDDSMFDRKFCSFVVSNYNLSNPARFNVFQMLNNEYTKVDSGGMAFNNIGTSGVEDKHEFISQYKFNIAGENSFVDDYVTEKIMDAFAARSIPIYIGTDKIFRDFNKEAFIYLENYDYEKLLNEVRKVNEDKELYKHMMTVPIFNRDGVMDEYIDGLSEYLYNIVENWNPYDHNGGRIYGQRMMFKTLFDVLLQFEKSDLVRFS